MSELSEAKATVAQFLDRVEHNTTSADLRHACTESLLPEHRYRGVRPFETLSGPQAVAETVLQPLRDAFRPLQRRPGIFLAGHTGMDTQAPVWVAVTGHILGHFVSPWLNIPPTGGLVYLPYASFFRVQEAKIAETVEFLDILAVMDQAGVNPLAEKQTAAHVMAPGPKTQDGLLFGKEDPEQGQATYRLVKAMLDDLVTDMRSPPEHMKRFWHSDMCWFGPAGIGACIGFDGYRRGHTGPWEERLEFIEAFPEGCLISEGNYAAVFWRPCLLMRPKGGFLGLSGTGKAAPMRVVDIYRRKQDRLAENWIFIDIPHFLNELGLDILAQVTEGGQPQ